MFLLEVNGSSAIATIQDQAGVTIASVDGGLSGTQETPDHRYFFVRLDQTTGRAVQIHSIRLDGMPRSQ